MGHHPSSAKELIMAQAEIAKETPSTQRFFIKAFLNVRRSESLGIEKRVRKSIQV
jgi:hypothetical protein